MSPAFARHESGAVQLVEGGWLVATQQARPVPHDGVSRHEIDGPAGQGWLAGMQDDVPAMMSTQHRCTPA